MAPMGTVWAPNTWDDDAWEINTWGDAQLLPEDVIQHLPIRIRSITSGQPTVANVESAEASE